MNQSARKVRILCLGNELVSDDGVGIRVGRILQALELPAGVTVELRRALGLGLLDELDPGVELLLVDASHTGSAAGDIHVMNLSTAAGHAQTPYCCHGVGVAEVLRLAERLDASKLPPRVTIIGIESSRLDEYGLELTPAVRDAIPDAVEAVLQQLDAPQETIKQGRREAERRKDVVPTIEEVVQ